MAKKEENKDLRYSQACIDLRAKLGAPALTEGNRKIDCDRRRVCYQEGCPIFNKEPPKANKDSSYSHRSERGVLQRCQRNNLKVFKEIEPDKAKKSSQEVEDFLWLQQRVMGKLAWHPEIWKALDKFSADDILDKLLGKTGLEEVPTLLGGKMPFEASKQTKKMFADLENQFAEEDKKSGKNSIHNLGESEQLTLGKGEFSLDWREPHGYFENGVYKKPEGKKNGKKNKDVPEKT